MNIWFAMFLGGLLTYATRLSFIVLLGRRQAPEILVRGLRFVPPAVLTAIIVPELLMPGGNLDISFGNLRLIAGLAAILVAWRTRNAVFTILVGLLALWGLQALLVP